MESPSRPARRSVLVVNADEELFAKIAPLLNREALEVDRFPRARAALDLVSQVPVDVLIVGYPLPDVRTQELLDVVRRPESPCRQSPLLLLAHREELEEAKRFIGRGANEAIAVEESAERLQAAVSRLLAVAPRSSLRMMVRIVVNIGEGAALEMSQTENLSETGMLVRTGEVYPLGSRLSFEFHLGGQSQPIRGEGEVVRQTTAGRESVRGIGIRFISLERDGLLRLQRFLRELSTER
ncbi:MAG TPA: PilZ domain-containing protein [Thermoanaerobaculia bacterium]|nr:PilZ domain-containing protein [Thermoanaerobaculia bacterium]HXT51302.1 PilZ domain-containing protein [Thermoanaerobaculia bacterium]